jgi:hypothetical protein
MVKSWKRRYFVLTGSGREVKSLFKLNYSIPIKRLIVWHSLAILQCTLRYSVAEKAPSRGEISLSADSCTLIDTSSIQNDGFNFAVISPGRTITLSAATDKERRDWIKYEIFPTY